MTAKLPDGDMRRFGYRLKRVMTMRGLSQKSFAEEMGVCEDLVGRWCRGTNAPTMRSLILICRVLVCSADYLMGLDAELRGGIGGNR